MSYLGSAKHISIQTPRLLLRPMTIEDADDLFLLRSDPETWRYVPIKPDKTVAQTRKWIRKIRDTYNNLLLCIELRTNAVVLPREHPHAQSPKAIGFLSAIGFPGALYGPEIGYGINCELRGRGYMSEALRAFVAAYWDIFPEGHPGLDGDAKNTLIARTTLENGASQTVLRRCGFEYWVGEEVRNKGKRIRVVWYRLWRPQ